MNDNFVVITTIIDPYRTINLVDKYLLDKDIAEVWIYDNGHKEEDAQHLYSHTLMNKRCLYFSTRGMNLAQQWNHAIIKAAEMNGNLIISNDDVIIEGNLGKELGSVLRLEDNIAIAYPANKITNFTHQDTKGSKADGGMHGECFMIKPELFIDKLIDERFTYWGLDDEIVQNAFKAGYRQVKVNTCSINSDSMGTTGTKDFEWMLDARKDDLKLLKDKWKVDRGMI
jgi:GT2 family glycosyltransferase